MTTQTEHDAEQLGRLVRETWVDYAREQPDPKPAHLLPWEELDEGNREVDRRIGVRVAAFVSIPLADEVEGLQAQIVALQTYLWRVREVVMHQGGWCSDYETAEGARIAEAVNAIWREARDTGLHPFAPDAATGRDDAAGERDEAVTVREMREQQLRAMGWAIPLTYANETQADRRSREAMQAYAIRHPDDPVTQRDMRDALGLPRGEAP